MIWLSKKVILTPLMMLEIESGSSVEELAAYSSPRAPITVFKTSGAKKSINASQAGIFSLTVWQRSTLNQINETVG